MPSSPQSKLAGRLWILTAALMWSSGGLFAKWPIFYADDTWTDEIRGPLMAFWRALFATMFLLPMIRRPRWNRLLIPLGGCYGLMCVTFLVAMTRTTAGNAIWLQATSPWWVFLLAVVVFREPVIRRDLIPLAFGVLGVGMILVFEVHGQEQFGVFCGIMSGVTYGAVVVLMRQMNTQNAAWLVAVGNGAAALLLLPWVIALGIWPSPVQLLALAGFGVFQMALPYMCLVRGLRSISSQEAVAITLIEPVLNPLWVALMGWELPAWWTVVGASLILTGLVLRFVVWELWLGENFSGRISSK